MNIHDLQELITAKTYPSLTITLPTHRTSPDNQQDPIRLKNLVTEATNRLRGEFSQREVGPLLVKLDDLVNDVSFPHLQEGLALFVSADIARWFTIPHTLQERVVIDDTFFTRDLVRALTRLRRYWVLKLSEQPSRLFAATREDLEEMTDGGFPMRHDWQGEDEDLEGGFGVNVSRLRDDRLRQFFRSVDQAFAPFLAEDPLPIVIVGIDRNLAFYREVAPNVGDVLATITGNYDELSAHDLGQMVWPVAREAFVSRRLEVLDQLNKAVGAQRSSSTLGEVWREAQLGRGDTLVVEEGYHQPARVGDNGLLDLNVDDPTAPDVLDDAVDEVITAVLEKGGRVVFVEDGELEKHGRIALILRY